MGTQKYKYICIESLFILQQKVGDRYFSTKSVRLKYEFRGAEAEVNLGSGNINTRQFQRTLYFLTVETDEGK